MTTIDPNELRRISNSGEVQTGIIGHEQDHLHRMMRILTLTLTRTLTRTLTLTLTLIQGGEIQNEGAEPPSSQLQGTMS